MSAPSAPQRRPSPYGAAVERDDRLLTALADARGEQALGGDPVAALLGAWRREVRRAGDRALRRPAQPEPVGAAGGPPGRFRTGPPAARWRRTGLMAAAAAVAACAALGMGALHARPADPLWRLTQVVYPQRATAQLIEETLGEARTALAERRLRDADARVAHAAALLDRLATGPQSHRLSAELEAIRRAIAVAQPAGDGPATTGSHGPTPGTGPTGTDANGTDANGTVANGTVANGTVANGEAGAHSDAAEAPPAGTRQPDGPAGTPVLVGGVRAQEPGRPRARAPRRASGRSSSPPRGST